MKGFQTDSVDIFPGAGIRNLNVLSFCFAVQNNRRGYIKDKLTVVQGKRVQRKGKKKNKAKKTKKSA